MGDLLAGWTRAAGTALGLVAALGNGSAHADAADTTPAGMVAFFMTSGNECPSGWAAPPNAQGQGRLLLGVTDAGRVGILVGAPLQDQTAPTHQHDFQTWVTLEEKEISPFLWKNSQGARAGVYPAPAGGPGTTTADTARLPFIQLVICQKQ